MGELLIKPYEISVWEDKLTQDGSRFVEKKLAVIGSNTMTGPNKVYEPVFNKKANGERTLTFSLKYKYFDPYNENHEVINPFVNLLINERKIKLKYGSDWYEFVIKEHNESNDEYTWTYTCTDAFVLELSKNGYDLTFDAELNNNQGTAKELAKKVLEDTDWILDESSSVGRQLVTEPIYKARILSATGLEIVNTDDTDETIESGQDIYLFYSYVANKNGKFIQFIIRDDTRPYIIDDQNVITDTNFRIITDLVFKNDGFYLENTNTKIITWSEVETQFQANRLAYHQLTTYDPVTQRTVNCFKLGDREVYQYSDNTYTTSNVVINYITNGENFNSLEDGTLQGWSPYVELDDGNTVKALELVTKPELKTGKALANINVLSQVEGFLKAYFYGPINNSYHNLIFNSGAQDNASTIHSISKGQKFVFRWRAGTGDLNNLQPAQNLRLLVAKYTQDVLDHPGYYYKHIDPENIILDFSSATNHPEVLNNIITGGYIQTNNYIIDGIAQEPSVKYIYVDKNTDQQYIWNGAQGRFDLLTQNNYLPYYYLMAEASKTVSNIVLSDPAERIGIFIYTTGNEAAGYYYIEDIQLTAYIEDQETHKPILIGNVPTAASNRTDYYYLKPTSEIDANEVETYSTPEALIEQIGEVGVDELIPIYNEDSDKVLSIKASQSNCFNILQTIAETFECWVDLVVDHNDKGEITYTDGKPNKYVYLKEYAGKDNYAGFKYAINLQSIERNINSDEIVTKLIVSQSQSDYVDEGYISIANAPSNPSGEAYILNFDYYYNQGLLDREIVEEDKLAFITAVKNINTELQEKEKEKADLELALTKLNSKRTTYTELIETAKDGRNINLVEFEQLTGQTYNDYCTEHDNIIAEETAEGVNPEDSKQLTNEDTLLDILGEIYVKSAAINNYSGLLTNVNTEYTDLRLKLKGAENFKVKVWTEEDSNQQRHIYVELDDYLPYFKAIIDTSEYEFTVNKRYIDVISDSEQITFEVPPDSTYEMDSYVCTINDNKIQTFKITNTDTTQGVEDEIDDLLDQKQQLVKEFNNKYRRFIQEGTWNSTDYIDSELYYLDALQVSNTSAQPTVSYTIDVVEISQLEGYEWYSFDAGDKTYVEDTEFFGWSNHNGILTPAREEVIVSEVEWHLDEPENNTITVQNYKTRFEDLFQRINAAVQTVQYNEATYAKISSLLDADGTINSDVLINSINNLNGKKYNLVSDGSIIVEGDQILVRNLTNSANLVKINSEGIKISSDGGSSWATAIDGRGINLGTVYTGMLNTDQVIIGNKDNPSFRWDKSGISAYQINNDTGIYDLKTFVRYDQYGLYGIKNNEYFTAQSLQDIKDKAHFAVTWDGFFIKNSYEGGGRVEITSDNDFRVLNTINQQEQEKIKIGALEWTDLQGNIYTDPDNLPDGIGGPSLYGIRIKNDSGAEVMKTDDEGNITIAGTINASAGEIGGMTVNNDWLRMNYIVLEPGEGIYSTYPNIKGEQPVGPSIGAYPFWISDTDGSATFNNVTVRGSIKTSVFEYEEIQAVGGAFMFRPSTTIRTATIDGGDLIFTVEKPLILRDGAWYKLCNYNSNDAIDADELTNYGLTHIYQLSLTKSNDQTIIKLLGAAAILQTVDINDIAGGSLIDMGFEPNTYRPISLISESNPSMLGLYELVNNEYILTSDVIVDENKTYYKEWYQDGIHNYGIGINSSDNYINLPPRAISLFETIVDSTQNPKVTYNYRGILGTLPDEHRNNLNVNSSVYSNMRNTQGIYTDNMYIGDNNQYIAFYEDDNGDKQLKIKANQVVYEVIDETTGQSEWHDVSQIETEGVPGPAGPAGQDGEDAIYTIIDSSAGNVFINGIVSTILRCYVYKGGVDITNDNNYRKTYTWAKINIDDGSIIQDWTPTSVPLEPNAIRISTSDVTHKAVFQCSVDVEEV